MTRQQIRHLPVVDDGELVGILSERDVRATHGPEGSVYDAMTSPAVALAGATPLDEVIDVMDTKRVSSVVIVGKTGVEGIFTLCDAMRAFKDLLGRIEDSER